MTLDVMSNSPFVSQENELKKAIWKDNLVVDQILLPIGLFSMHPFNLKLIN